ncbi:40S ribosomal S8 [Gossypium arboreum]|uniref:40S ribosomal S8 n=1 Tax=Gossypium arboreum TaxID=29729 RepID=A0A0B0MKK8_GOSAR|nr:40S ribosomal S8 [Gossypium arboreum]
MGISRDSMHKRLATGGKKKAWRKKRKYELGRQPANPKLSTNKTGSEAVTRKTRILDVVYNASNSKLVRTQTLLKSAIVQVDAALCKQWYLQHCGVDIGRKSSSSQERRGESGTEEAKKSNHVMRKPEKQQLYRGSFVGLHLFAAWSVWTCRRGGFGWAVRLSAVSIKTVVVRIDTVAIL